MSTQVDEIIEGVYSVDLWDRLDFHWGSYVKSPLQLRFLSTKTTLIGRALRDGIVSLLNCIASSPDNYVENETTILGTECRLYHSAQCRILINDLKDQFPEMIDPNNEMRLEISSLAPTVFHQLRKDIGIDPDEFLRSFSKKSLKDFTNPGKSGSLMYKTHDDLFILKTLREYEARLLMQILSGYHLHFQQRSTLFNRYVGLYIIRFPTSISTIEIYLTVMINAFTPSLRLNEIFDLKGSKIKRKLNENLSSENLFKLKDLDFLDLYPMGFRIPTLIYQRLKQIVANDTKVLRKLNITDFSLILGVRHLDTSASELFQRRPSSGVAALMHLSNRIAMLHIAASSSLDLVPTESFDEPSTFFPYLKPMKMIGDPIDTSKFYLNDPIAQQTKPIPAIVNQTNERVYLYFAIVDMLQTFDSVKLLDQTLRRFTDRQRRFEYSVIASDDYEIRFNQFLFEKVFTDAQDDFPWNFIDVSQTIDLSTVKKEKSKKLRRRPHSIERQMSGSIVESRF